MEAASVIAPETLVVDDPRSGTWTIELASEVATFRSADRDTTHSVSRADSADHVELLVLPGAGAHLIVKLGGIKLQLPLAPDQRARIEAWLGPPTEKLLRVTLDRRYKASMIFAVLWIFMALTGPDNDVDPWNLGLGLGLFGLWAHAKWAPRAYLFLLDAAWWLLLVVKSMHDVHVGRSGVWLLVVALFTLIGVVSGVRQFRRFRHVHQGAGL